MYTLWLYPPNYPEGGPDEIARQNRFRIRARALGTAIPAGKRTLYLDSKRTKSLDVLSETIGEVDVKYPGDEVDLSDSVRIVASDADTLTQAITEATGDAFRFDRPGAALTHVDESGEESLIWSYPASDWIFLALPEEPYVPPRVGTGISLQSLMAPKIEEAAILMRKNLDWYLRAPHEVEAVHQLRVSIRSFRALISLVKQLLPERTYAELQDHFRQLARQCALLRELDVLLEEWEETDPHEGSAFSERLKGERKEEEERLLGFLQKDDTQRAFQVGVNRFVQALSHTEWGEIDGIEFMDRKLHGWYRYILEATSDLKGFDFPTVHKIRLKSKKYRYIAEHFKEHVTPLQKRRHKSAKEKQTTLGKICDSLRNQEAVDELLKSGADPRTREEADSFVNRERERENSYLAELGLATDPIKHAEALERIAHPPDKSPKTDTPEEPQETVLLQAAEAVKEAHEPLQSSWPPEPEQKRISVGLVAGIVIACAILLYLIVVKLR